MKATDRTYIHAKISGALKKRIVAAAERDRRQLSTWIEMALERAADGAEEVAK